MIISSDKKTLLKVEQDDIVDGIVTVPEGITEIAHHAFANHTNIVRVILPKSIHKIGYCAFQECTSLRELTLPIELTEIERSAFDGCVSLNDMNLPEGIWKISRATFERCYSLIHITLPQGLREIQSMSFNGCVFLGSIVIPQGVIRLDDAAFSNCVRLDSITLPQGLKEIGNNTFFSCISFTSITLPKGLMLIGDNAFSNCHRLKYIHFPQGLAEIGHSALFNCVNLTSITLPEGIMLIGDNAFENCPKLESIFIDSLDDNEIARITQLLPAHLQRKVISKDNYQRIKAMQEEILNEFQKVEVINKAYNGMVFHPVSGKTIPPELFQEINFFDDNNPAMLDFKNAVISVPFDNLEHYQTALKDLFHKHANQVKKASYLSKLSHLISKSVKGFVNTPKPPLVLHHSSPILNAYNEKMSDTQALVFALQKLIDAEKKGIPASLSDEEILILKSQSEINHVLKTYEVDMTPTNVIGEQPAGAIHNKP